MSGASVSPRLIPTSAAGASGHDRGDASPVSLASTAGSRNHQSTSNRSLGTPRLIASGISP